MKLLVVIVNYRVAQLTLDCLRSIAEELPHVPGTAVAVCENGSGDNSAQLIQKAISDNGWESWCGLTVLSANLGFAGGNNLVIRSALRSADPPNYVLLLNADTLVRPCSMKLLVDFMERHPEVGVAGSRLEDTDGTPQRSAFRFPSPLSEFEGAARLGVISRLLEDWVAAPPVPTESCETDWVPGASMIVRRAVFEQIGLLDEGFFTYFEDVDFCRHARNVGWQIWYVPESRVVHLVGQSSGITASNPGRKPEYVLEARRRYLLKHDGPLKAALADLAQISGLALRRLRCLFDERKFMEPHLLGDCIKHSVFTTGFALRIVQPPASEPPRTNAQKAAATATEGVWSGH